jgi:hypothetical protein
MARPPAELVAGHANPRIERKLRVTELTTREVESLVRLHPAAFSVRYPPRHVNSLYLDSGELTNVYDNVNGVANRVKVRIRWYGELLGEVPRPVLELKVKRGVIGFKDSFPLCPLVVDRGFRLQTVLDVLARSPIGDLVQLNVSSLELAAITRYRRQYLESADRRYRLTIDSEMACYRVRRLGNAFVQRWSDAQATVVELKYAVEDDVRADEITRHFPFRITKSSKYVGGITMMHG